jgi:hypothetical protein
MQKENLKKYNEVKNKMESQYLSNLIKQYQRRKKLERILKARSFKEFLTIRVEMEVKDELMDKGLAGSELLTYLGFTKKVLREAIICGTNYIDDIMNLYEKVWLEKYKVNADFIKICEEVIINNLKNIEIIESDYNKLFSSK